MVFAGGGVEGASFPIHRRECFGRNLDVSQATLHVEDLTSPPLGQMEQLVSTFNRFGFCIVEHGESPDPKAQLIQLSRAFGSVNHHDRSDSDGTVTVAKQPSFDAYIATKTVEHAPHTDGAYDVTPPRLVCPCSASGRRRLAARACSTAASGSMPG